MLTLAAGGMADGIATDLAVIVGLAIGAQWVAWRLKLPSILLLLIAGFVSGPVIEWLSPGSGLDPDELLGDLLTPIVGLAVGIILFEGGLTLKLREISGVKRVVFLLVSAGALVTWLIAALGARYILGLSPGLSTLVGAILIVSGPTVVGPLLQHVRPAGMIGPVLRWEGIVIDPIGVLMAVLVFEALSVGGVEEAVWPMTWAIIKTVIVGGGLGVVAALVLLTLLSRYWVPDFLQNPVALTLVVGSVALANMIQAESGLLTATLMGIILANQRRADVSHILEFKENLRVLLLSALFIVLAARLRTDDLGGVSWPALAAYLVLLIVIARPLAAWVSTIGAGLTWRERAFAAYMAPRGIVAAAGASIFALALETGGNADARVIVPVVFAVIVGTVAFYGLTASPVARWLGVADQNPQGILFVGGSPWVREVARILDERGVRVVIADTNRSNVRSARMQGITAQHIDVLGEFAMETLDLRGIGRLCASTPNDEVNALVVKKFVREFGSAGVFQLPAKAIARPVVKPSTKPLTTAKPAGDVKPGTGPSSTLVGRHLFRADLDYDTVTRRLAAGHVIKATTLSQEFDYERYRTLYGPDAVLLAVADDSGSLALCSADSKPKPEPGQTVIGLVDPDALLMGGPRF